MQNSMAWPIHDVSVPADHVPPHNAAVAAATRQLHATLLHQLGLEPERMEVPAHKRLEMDFGHVIKDIIA